MPVVPGLSVQLARLDRAIERLGPDGVADALRRHLQQLRPAERDGFVAVFEATAPVGDASLLAEVAAVVDDLPQAVDELMDDRWRRRRRRRWDDPWESEDGPSVVRDSVDDLYGRLGERFLAGDTATAVAGYRRLLDAAVAAVDDPDGVHVSGSEGVAREGLARMVCALLEDNSQSHGARAMAAVDALGTYRLVVPTPTVAEVVDARPGGLVADDEMLGAWLEACEREARARLSWEGRPFHHWLVDLVTRTDGPDGLSRLATDATYPHRVQAYTAWIDLLEEAGRLDDAVSAATEAVDALDLPLERAPLVDRLAGLYRSAGDRSASAMAGTRALRDDPTLYRLRWVLDDARAAGLDHGMVSELVAAVDSHGDASPLVHVAVLVLAGRLQDVAAAARSEGRPGRLWNDQRASQVVATGALLLGCRSPVDDVAARLSARLVDTVDAPGVGGDHRAMLALARGGGRRADAAEPGPLGPQLRASITATAAHVAHLQQASDLVAATADGVLGAKDRADYATVARMVVALAHTTAAVDGSPAELTIADYDTRFRRFSAFRAELRKAAEQAVSGAGSS